MKESLQSSTPQKNTKSHTVFKKKPKNPERLECVERNPVETLMPSVSAAAFPWLRQSARTSYKWALRWHFFLSPLCLAVQFPLLIYAAAVPAQLRAATRVLRPEFPRM